MQSSNLLVVTGKTFGITNIIALDADRKIIKDQRVIVERDEKRVVNLHKAGIRQSYSCTPNCSPTLTIGSGAVVLFLLVLMFLLGGLVTRESGFPTRLAERYVGGELTGPKVAVVEVEGAIGDESADHAIRQLRQARTDDLVKAVVLRVDSPGGTVTGSDRIWREALRVDRQAAIEFGHVINPPDASGW